MKNIVELRNHIAAITMKLAAGKIKPSVAKETNNAAGKVVSTIKLEIEYDRYNKANPGKELSIDFMKKK